MAAAIPLVLIASVARNGSIGRGGELVWDEPADKRWFRQQTLGCPVIMGRKTWESLPARFRPLPGRANVVVSRQGGFEAPGAQLAPALPEALALARHSAAASGAARVFVIGGAALYALALPLADELLLTEIDADLPGDTYFPPWRRSEWAEVERLPQAASAAGHFAFVRYRRLSAQ
jgi:dihydrofolate reductase